MNKRTSTKQEASDFIEQKLPSSTSPYFVNVLQKELKEALKARINNPYPFSQIHI